MTHSTIIDSPIGHLELIIVDNKLHEMHFVKKNRTLITSKTSNTSLTKNIAQQLQNYFNNPHFQFDLPLLLHGTAFQLRVWQAMRTIPAGKALTYGELAKQLNTSARAIGNACRANPVPIILPCHRIVAATGLGGFNGTRQGRFLFIKRWLLQHEKYLTPIK